MDKQCRVCGEWKPGDLPYFRTNSRRGTLRTTCLECERVYHRRHSAPAGRSAAEVHQSKGGTNSGDLATASTTDPPDGVASTRPPFSVDGGTAHLYAEVCGQCGLWQSTVYMTDKRAAMVRRAARGYQRCRKCGGWVMLELVDTGALGSALPGRRMTLSVLNRR